MIKETIKKIKTWFKKRKSNDVILIQEIYTIVGLLNKNIELLEEKQESELNNKLYYNTQLAKFIIKNLVSDLKGNTRL